MFRPRTRPTPESPARLPHGAAPAVIRPAALADLSALVHVEQRCFDADRLNRRQMRYMLTRAQASLLVAELPEGGVVGYALVLFRRGTSLARLYSIAVDPGLRRVGLGRRLLEAAEEAARERDCAYLRLEVRRDNEASIRLYRAAGYRRFDEVDDYYEDGMAAVRLERALAGQRGVRLVAVPYYRQTLDFTCGPAALMMAMQALDPELEMSRKLELRIWREATTVFMTSGHGGCSPFGLALSAARRGFGTEVLVSDPGVPLIDSVRSPDKKEVMRLVHEDMLEEAREAGIRVRHHSLCLDTLRARFEAGGLPLVLISSYHLTREKIPHWVVVTGFEERFVYVHEPDVDEDLDESPADCMNLPIWREDFSRMARYGRAGLQAVVMVYPRERRASRSPVPLHG